MTARPGKWTPSISWRIGAALAIVAISVFGAVAAYAYGAILRDYEQHDALELRSKAELVRRVLAQAGSAADIPAAGERLREVVLGHRGLSLVIFDQAGRLLLAVPDVELPSLPPEHGSDAEAIEAFSSRGAAGLARYRILRGRVAPSGDAARFALVLDVSMEADLAARHLRSIGLASTAGAVLSAVLGVLIVRRQLRPLAAVTAEARRVSASNLDVDLPTAGQPGELRALAEAFNDMLASLRASFARLTAFSADLAHELRTPGQHDRARPGHARAVAHRQRVPRGARVKRGGAGAARAHGRRHAVPRAHGSARRAPAPRALRSRRGGAPRRAVL